MGLPAWIWAETAATKAARVAKTANCILDMKLVFLGGCVGVVVV